MDDLKNNSGRTGVGLFKGGYNDLPMSRLMMRTGTSHEITLPITGTISGSGELSMHPHEPVGAVLCPSTLSEEVGLYAVRLGADIGVLPNGAIFVIAPTMSLRKGDWAIYKVDSQSELVRIQSVSEQKEVCIEFFVSKKDNKKVLFNQLERIVWIVLL